MDIIAEIRWRYFIENETITSLAEVFKLFRPTIRKQLKTVEKPVYQRQHQPHPKSGVSQAVRSTREHNRSYVAQTVLCPHTAEPLSAVVNQVI